MVTPGYTSWRERQRSHLQTSPHMRGEDGLLWRESPVVPAQILKRDDHAGPDNHQQQSNRQRNNDGCSGKGDNKHQRHKDNCGDDSTTTATTTTTSAPGQPIISLVAPAPTPPQIPAVSQPSLIPLAAPPPAPPPVAPPVIPLLSSSAVPTMSFFSTTATPPSISATTVWLTASSVATVTVGFTPSSGIALADTTPSTTPSATSSAGDNPLFLGQQDGGNGDKHHGGKHHDPPPPPPNNNRFAIAFGTIGALGFLVGIIWAAVLFRRWQRNHRRDDQSVSDASTLGKPRPRRFQFNWPSLPFRRSVHARWPAQPPFSMRFGDATKRSNASIMDEAMSDAYGSESATINSSVQAYHNEKRHDPNYPLPILEPAPVQQASIRKSIASWFRQASRHHPLRLNPMRRGSRSTTATGGTSAAALSRTNTGSQSQYSTEQYPVPVTVHELPADSIPPMPGLGKQAAYAAAAAAAAAAPIVTSGSSELSTPTSVFTRDDPQVQIVSPCSDTSSSVVAEVEGEPLKAGPEAAEAESESGKEGPGKDGAVAAGRMSASSWTSVTRTTTMQGDRASRITQTAGLSPPIPPSQSNRASETSTAVLAVPGGGEEAGSESLTNLHEELVGLYAPHDERVSSTLDAQGSQTPQQHESVMGSQ